MAIASTDPGSCVTLTTFKSEIPRRHFDYIDIPTPCILLLNLGTVFEEDLNLGTIFHKRSKQLLIKYA
jgi:hypothetical protein